MNIKDKQLTRRRFLKTSAGATLPLMCTVPCFAEKASSAVQFSQSGQRDHYKVFSKGRIGILNLKNRLIKSATWEGAARNGEYTDAGIPFYKGLAEGGVGLIISGGITMSTRSYQTFTAIHEDRFIPFIAKIADAVHHADDSTKVIAQLAHGGMSSDATNLAPSDVPWPHVNKKLHVLSTEDVEKLVAEFVAAAIRVQQAGFDGVQLHCAHYYLLHSFLSPYTNKRTDKYGGSVEKRATIVREIVTQIRHTLRDFPILVKMNCDDYAAGGIDKNNFAAHADQVANTGVDAIELTVGGSRTGLRDIEKQSYLLEYAEALNLDIPVILTHGNKNIERLETIMQEGKVNFLGMARPLIREPNLPNRWLEGGDDSCECISCNQCIGSLFQGELIRCQKVIPIVDRDGLIPHSFELVNYPNPFNPTTTIEYTVPKSRRVRLTMYDGLGRQIRALLNHQHQAGRYQTLWDGMDERGLPVAGGLYYCRMQAGNYSKVIKMALVR